MKTIGFVDYYISEWHADNYPKWIREACEQMGLEYEVKYAWAEMDISPVTGLSTDEWCQKMGVTRAKSLDELCTLCDYIVVLAPSNPETHLRLAEQVLKYGKRTYIDKTFAPDFDTTQKIFALGQQYNAPFFSTSALRYASELKDFGHAEKVILTGGGRLFDEYLVHLVEMAVVLMPESRFTAVKTECVGSQRICRCACDDGKEVVLIYSPGLGYSILSESADGQFKSTPVTSSFFLNLICDILRFFETGAQPFDSAQTLEVMLLRDRILKAEKMNGVWMNI